MGIMILLICIVSPEREGCNIYLHTIMSSLADNQGFIPHFLVFNLTNSQTGESDHRKEEIYVDHWKK